MIEIKDFFDPATSTLTYVVFDTSTRDAVVIDPVLDFDPPSGRVSETSLGKLIRFIATEKLRVHYSVETHAHADHLTSAQRLKSKIPGMKILIGKNITLVQDTFKKILNLKDLNPDGSQFDRLLSEDEEVSVAGAFTFKLIFTPGHTPACSSILIEDAVFTGDAIFMPDSGTGRCDFPGGSARNLYNSIHEKIYKLPDSTRIFVGHDYQPGGREIKYQSSVGEQKKSNIQLKQETTEKEFLEFRSKRDATLSAPRLLLPSIQVNIEAGRLPEPEDNGVSYLKLPLSE